MRAGRCGRRPVCSQVSCEPGVRMPAGKLGGVGRVCACTHAGGLREHGRSLHACTQGCVSRKHSIAFLEELVELLLLVPSPPASAAGSCLPECSTAAEARLLEFACERLSSLTSEQVHLFPSDINAVLQRHRWATTGCPPPATGCPPPAPL